MVDDEESKEGARGRREKRGSEIKKKVYGWKQGGRGGTNGGKEKISEGKRMKERSKGKKGKGNKKGT